MVFFEKKEKKKRKTDSGYDQWEACTVTHACDPSNGCDRAMLGAGQRLLDASRAGGARK